MRTFAKWKSNGNMNHTNPILHLYRNRRSLHCKTEIHVQINNNKLRFLLLLFHIPSKKKVLWSEKKHLGQHCWDGITICPSDIKGVFFQKTSHYYIQIRPIRTVQGRSNYLHPSQKYEVPTVNMLHPCSMAINWTCTEGSSVQIHFRPYSFMRTAPFCTENVQFSQVGMKALDPLTMLHDNRDAWESWQRQRSSELRHLILHLKPKYKPNSSHESKWLHQRCRTWFPPRKCRFLCTASQASTDLHDAYSSSEQGRPIMQ